MSDGPEEPRRGGDGDVVVSTDLYKTITVFSTLIAVVFAATISALSVKNLVPMDSHLLFDLTFLLPIVGACISYAVFKSMREGYMFELNRRYYRLRPPK